MGPIVPLPPDFKAKLSHCLVEGLRKDREEDKNYDTKTVCLVKSFSVGHRESFSSCSPKWSLQGGYCLVLMT